MKRKMGRIENQSKEMQTDEKKKLFRTKGRKDEEN